jgi:dTDP-4-dehydrorhamnose 3,5-epimerase/reductase
VSPLGVYGKSKASGDEEARYNPKHYIVRSSWVIGDGPNFARTMQRLANSDESPCVVNDQFGRPTFTPEMAAGIEHLVTGQLPYGTYNLTGSGPVVHWADIARFVFEQSNAKGEVHEQTTEQWAAKQSGVVASRPRNSALSIAAIEASGLSVPDWRESLIRYMSRELLSA